MVQVYVICKDTKHNGFGQHQQMEQGCLMFTWACISEMASFFLDHGLRSVGLIQYPNQSFSWTAHSHLEGFTIKLFCSQQGKMRSKVWIWFGNEDEKCPILSK